MSDFFSIVGIPMGISSASNPVSSNPDTISNCRLVFTRLWVMNTSPCALWPFGWSHQLPFFKLCLDVWLQMDRTATRRIGLWFRSRFHMQFCFTWKHPIRSNPFGNHLFEPSTDVFTPGDGVGIFSNTLTSSIGGVRVISSIGEGL